MSHSETVEAATAQGTPDAPIPQLDDEMQYTHTH